MEIIAAYDWKTFQSCFQKLCSSELMILNCVRNNPPTSSSCQTFPVHVVCLLICGLTKYTERTQHAGGLFNPYSFLFPILDTPETY
jgi:hypothetical protein